MANKFTGIGGTKKLKRTESEQSIAKALEPPTELLQTSNNVRRPNGKKSGDDFRQITAYVRKDTLREIKNLLLEREEIGLDKLDFSDVIEEGLERWIEHEKRYRL